MTSETAAKVRVSGLVRSPDREGALAHFDPDRGFALVARSSMGLTDVIDPTIWVREKIALSLVVQEDTADPPLKRALTALRSIHGELMARSERERTWVSVLVALLDEGDGAAVLAGDCACYRFRDGRMARLGRVGEPVAGRPPAGALGTETQVRIEVVPLHPRAGDCYILSTDPLGEGELARLTRDLEGAHGEAAVLRHAIEGSPEKGRVALVVHRGDVESTLPVGPGAEALTGLGSGELDAALAPLTLEPLDAAIAPPPESRAPISLDRPLSERPAASLEPVTAPGTTPLEPVLSGREPEDAYDGAAEAGPGEAGRIAEEEASPTEEEAALTAEPRRARPLAALEEGRPWYEPIAIWAAGALAIVALAILVRSIVPGILGGSRERAPEPVPIPANAGTVDVYSEPPGAVIRVDGVPIEQKTPASGLALEPGVHRIELDWGPYGTWSDTVDVITGERLTVHPVVTGQLSFRSSDPARLLDVFLDGSYVGSTPLSLEAVPVGRHLVRFGAPGTSVSAQEFELFRDTPLELVGSAGPVPEPGSLTIRTALLGDAGYEPGRGDPVWVDGELKGVTPASVSLRPGHHSVRVVRRGFPAQISVIEVKPGGKHFVTAEFGAQSEEPLVFAPPLSLSASNPIPLSITLPESEWNESRTVWLHAAPPGGTFVASRMEPADGEQHTFSSLVPAEVLGNATKKVRVYFRAVGPAGQETCSEIQTIPVKE